MPENAASLPDFTRWPSFPFEGDMRVKDLAAPVAVEPPRSGEDASDCVACNTPDDAYIWENERWRVRAMDRPTGLPMVLILECRSHLDMGDLPNLLAAELGVMTVRLERAIRSLDGVARVHVNRWGDGSAHLHMWFLARPYGRLQLRGTFLSLWDDILPTIPEDQWRENLALVAAWLAEFGGHANTEPAHIQWQSPSTFSVAPSDAGTGTEYASASTATGYNDSGTSAESKSAPSTDAGGSDEPNATTASPTSGQDAARSSEAWPTHAEAHAVPMVSRWEADTATAGAGQEPAEGDDHRAQSADHNAAADIGQEPDGTSGKSTAQDPIGTGNEHSPEAGANPETADHHSSTNAGSGAVSSNGNLTATGSGSDHVGSSAGSRADAADTPSNKPSSASTSAEGGSPKDDPDDGEEDPASARGAESEKGQWRPNDLGEAESPSPSPGANTNRASA